MTELIAAERMALGEGPIPMPYGNSWLVPLRISGTGAAYRASIDEFVWRGPEIWLSDNMQRRCIGLPIVVGHPEAGVLDGKSFRASIVGLVIWSFVRDDELWGVGRFFDQDVAKQITGETGFSIDTSPSVVFSPEEITTVILDDGKKLTIEAIPGLIDHLALVITEPGDAGGVWSKGRKTTGIDKTEKKELAHV